ncbi:cytochrome P450 [Lentinula aciculospora]|uniref:Cytochrome P450 n=1 Tax=Lentinula aciculospora TaxID=153920 RepID=A0A9W9AA76_9AGAR|nr:cytochrome P450 [Lentinula aciculospora]
MHWAFRQADSLWRSQRRGAHDALNSKTAKEYFRYQETESIIMLDQMPTTPENFIDHFQRASTSLTLSIVYGWPPILDSAHPSVLHIDRFSRQLLVAAAPGPFWVELEYFKWMKYLPRWMCAWRRNAENAFSHDSMILEGLCGDVQKQIDAGDETKCVAGKLLKVLEHAGNTFEAAWNCASIYEAGAETTSGQLAWFTQAMILYPETQRIAQVELDCIVGPDRLPSFDDYNNLPYIRAIVKEILRWRGVVSLGVPHKLSQDDHYEGYLLPKDTVCFVNIWSLHRNTVVYGHDSEHFNPGRFLDVDGKLDSSIPDTRDEGHFSYGFRKRICAGRHVANNSLFIHIAFLLWAFNISPEINAHGSPNLPDPFQCIEGLTTADVADIVAQVKAGHGSLFDGQR